MVIAPTSSRKTREGLAILSSDFAALTAARAAERMALITPLRPAVIPAVSPAMAFTPTERSVLVFREEEAAFRTFVLTVLAVPLMLKEVMAPARPVMAAVPAVVSGFAPMAVRSAVSRADEMVAASAPKSYPAAP